MKRTTGNFPRHSLTNLIHCLGSILHSYSELKVLRKKIIPTMTVGCQCRDHASPIEGVGTVSLCHSFLFVSNILSLSLDSVLLVRFSHSFFLYLYCYRGLRPEKFVVNGFSVFHKRRHWHRCGTFFFVFNLFVATKLFCFRAIFALSLLPLAFHSFFF